MDLNPRAGLRRTGGQGAGPIQRRQRRRGQGRPAGPAAEPRTGMAPPRSWARPVVLAVLVRPGLWATGARQLFVLAAPGWWRRRPFLPLPDPDYLHFRLVTQYGDGGHPPEPADVVTYLRWCRALRADLRAEPGHPPGDDRLPF